MAFLAASNTCAVDMTMPSATKLNEPSLATFIPDRATLVVVLAVFVLVVVTGADVGAGVRFELGAGVDADVGDGVGAEGFCFTRRHLGGYIY